MPKSYDDLISLAVTDPAFRARLLADPKGTINAEGYELDPRLLQQIEDIDPVAAEAALKDIESSTDQRKAAM